MTLRLRVIVGPTATGKTRLGVQAAHRLGSEIVSADSRQVYRGLDIGAGKDLQEYARVSPPVPYHLIDIADPERPYTLYRYQRDCYRVLAAKAREERFAAGLPLVLVGGTGLYVEAVLRGYRIAAVPADAELRGRLEGLPHAELVRKLEGLDLELARRTDLVSTRRVIRAIEVATHERAHGPRHSAPPPVRLEPHVFVVDLPRPELHRRIEQRLAARLEQGLVAEVSGLLERGLPPARLEQLGLEYREVTAYLTGRKAYEAMVDDLAREIRKLAKRQQTWFRGMARRGIPATTIAPDDLEAVLRAGA